MYWMQNCWSFRKFKRFLKPSFSHFTEDIIMIFRTFRITHYLLTSTYLVFYMKNLILNHLMANIANILKISASHLFGNIWFRMESPFLYHMMKMRTFSDISTFIWHMTGRSEVIQGLLFVNRFKKVSANNYGIPYIKKSLLCKNHITNT